MAAITLHPTFVLLHPLGGSARSWDVLCPLLEPVGECLALDLPGFGDAACSPGGTDIDATLAYLRNRIATHVDGPWIAIGHSMGGKFATLLAAERPEGLMGVVLVAGSPPSPEPMDSSRRDEMLGWVADGYLSEDQAHTFLAANTASALPPDVEQRMISDLMRASPQAWAAWLTQGAAQDRSRGLPIVAVPALILAGKEDGDLGEENQRRLNLPHYAEGILRVVPGASHMMPQERPAMVAAHIKSLWHKILLSDDQTVDADTRRLLLRRLDGPASQSQSVLSDDQRDLLQAVVDRVVPQSDVPDLARRLNNQLARGMGDGWRFADLPPDAEAFAQALDTLHAAVPDFATASSADQDAILDRIADGRFHSTGLTAKQMKFWFEDLRAQAAREWISHPVTLARIGYDGLIDPRTQAPEAMQ